MYAVKAIYDGNIFKLDEPVPVKGEYEVIITFTKPVEKSQEEILQYFGVWDDEDVNYMADIIKDRENFSLNRIENDIS
jgi:predicted DNA-binding antitoxin AbrB/MazE fold protein